MGELLLAPYCPRTHRRYLVPNFNRDMLQCCPSTKAQVHAILRLVPPVKHNTNDGHTNKRLYFKEEFLLCVVWKCHSRNMLTEVIKYEKAGCVYFPQKCCNYLLVFSTKRFLYLSIQI